MVSSIRQVLTAVGAFMASFLMGATLAQAQSPEEQAAWEHAVAIGTKHDYENYLSQFPNGTHAQDAMNALLKLAQENTPAGPHTFSKTYGSRAGGGHSHDNSGGY